MATFPTWTQFLLCSHSEVSLEDPQWLICFISSSLVSAYFVVQENSDLKRRNIFKSHFFMQLWVIGHISTCNPKPPSHHWSIFFLYSKILEVRKGFECLALKRHENLILVTSIVAIARKMIFQSRAFTKLIVDLCIINQSSEQANLLCKNKKKKQKNTKNPAKSSSKP